MLQRDMTEGRRVKIARVIDVFPLGIFAAGLTGTVCDVDKDHDGALDEPFCNVLLDEPHAALAHWENKLQIYPADGWAECSVDNFEPI